jgi:hypothetical protein
MILGPDFPRPTPSLRVNHDHDTQANPGNQ